MNNIILTDDLIIKFTKYRNCIFYDPNSFSEVVNNNFETQTFSRTYLTKFNYKHSQKGLSNEQIRNNLLNTIKTKNFKVFQPIEKDLIITNNKYPYVATNNNQIFIIWCISGQTSIYHIKELVEKYFSKYDYIVWRNPNMHQSVKLIKHYHLVIREPIVKPILKKVLLIVRHGPREPIHLPNKFDSSYWNFDVSNKHITQTIKAKITCLGKLYCLFRGQEAKNYYFKDINFRTLTIDNIYVESSYVERTRESALYYMKGLGINIKKINISKFMASDKFFEKMDLEEYELYNTKFKLNIDTNKLNKLTEEITGQKINNPLDFFHVYSTIKCYKVHNYNLPKDVDKIFDLLEQITTLSYNELNDPKKNKYAKILGENMLFHIFDLLRENKKLYYLSTHDNMIMALLKYICFNYNIQIKLVDIPDFCSCVRFEIWNDDILRIYYDSLFLVETKFIN
jgi:hypothetical protein